MLCFKKKKKGQPLKGWSIISCSWKTSSNTKPKSKICCLHVACSSSYLITILFDLYFPCDLPENVPEDLREPLYKDHYEQEHLKPAVSKLLLSPDTYCQVQAQLVHPCGDSSSVSTQLPGDNSAMLQFLIKTGCSAKVKDKDVSEEDLSVVPIQMVCFWSWSFEQLRFLVLSWILRHF